MTTTNDASSEIDLNPGVFTLSPREAESAPEGSDATPPRHGASLTQWETGDTLETTPSIAEKESDSDDFPMTVWLRGDEPWFSQFDMDADAVMAALGIKRSRLTQISGRDLRVGRVRVDRYIRPVFRTIDVQDYLNQTRATASHQKSSDAIKSAAESLYQQSERFEHTLEAIVGNFHAHLNSTMGTLLAETANQALIPVFEKLDSLETDVVNRIVVSTHDALLKHVDSLSRKLDAQFEETLKEIQSTKIQFASMLGKQMEAIAQLDGKLVQADKQSRASCEETNEFMAKTLQSIQTLTTEIEHLKELDALKRQTEDKVEESSLKNRNAAQLGLKLRAAPNRRRHKG